MSKGQYTIFGVFVSLCGVYYALFTALNANNTVPHILLVIFAAAAAAITFFLFERTNRAIKAFTKGKEISNYWALRAEATPAVQKYLRETTTDELFISAIGFTTLNSILSDNRVIKNIAELVTKPQTPFKMTIVFPKNVSEWKKYRPDSQKTREEVQQNIRNGHNLIRQFIRNVNNQICNMHMTEQEREKISIEKRLVLRNYNDRIIPRHFILQGDHIIFVGSYLSHNQGSGSYLLQVKKHVSKYYRYARLFDLFKNEISHIIDNSDEISHNDFMAMTY